MDVTPACPRCGYDQSGAIAAWERIDPACCPLVGRCTECGLEFAWRNLLNPVYARQLRMFEHARQRKLASLLLTWWKAARPWSFWRWIRMEHDIVPGRVVLLAFLGAALTHACLFALQMIGYFAAKLIETYTATPFLMNFDVDYALVDAALPTGTRWYNASSEDVIAAVFMPVELVCVLTMLIMPFTFALLPDTLRKARVRRAHILRIWMYQLVWFAFALSIGQMLGGIVYIVEAMSVSGPPASMSLGEMLASPVVRQWITLAAGLGWMLAWWWFALARYLKLPQAAATTLVLLGLSLLASWALVLTTVGGWALIRISDLYW